MKLRFYIPYVIFLFVLLLVSPWSAFSQKADVSPHVVLSGRITDAVSGDPVPGVVVYVTELKTGTVSDIDGFYKLTNLPSRKVVVQLTCIGFKTIVESVDLAVIQKHDFSVSEAVAELGEVVVTGLSVATELQHTPAPVTTISPLKLRQSVATNIIDAITLAPGVSQVTTGPAISKPVIRGLGYNRVVVVNDGIRQEGQQWGDEHGIEVDEFSVHDVEILKGPASLSYGSDALAGVIQFLSDPVVPEGTLQGDLLLTHQTNSGLIGSSVNLAGNTKGNVWNFRLSQKASHDYKNKYDGYVWNSRFLEYAANGMAGINRSWGYSHLQVGWYRLIPGMIEGERDSLTGDFVKQSAMNDSIAVLTPVGSGEYTSFQPEVPRQVVEHIKVVSSTNYSLHQGSLKILAAWQQNQRKEYGNILTPDAYGLAFLLQSIHYDFRYIFPEKEGWNGSFGVNGMYQNSANKGIEFLVPEYRLFDAGIFGMVSKVLGKYDFSGGIRYDHRSEQGEPLYLDPDGHSVGMGVPGSYTKFQSFNNQFSGFSASIGATRQLGKKSYAKFNIAHGWRAPNIAELASNGEHEGTNRYEYGKAELVPEKSTQADGTFGWNSDHFTGEVSVFGNSVNDYIFAGKLASFTGADSLVNGMPAYSYGSGNAVLWGGEISLDLHPHPLDWLHVENTFSLVTGQLRNQPDSSRYLPSIPAPRLVTEVRAQTRKLSRAFANAFCSVGFAYTWDQDHIYSINHTETPTPGYGLLNAAVGADIMIKAKKLLSLQLGVTNLTDEAYQNHLSRLKYTPENYQTGRTGVYDVGRNVYIKMIIPIVGSSLD